MTNNRDYERHITHATDVNFLNNRYTLPITIKFFTTDSNSTVNISSKYRTLSSPSEFLIFPPQLSPQIALSSTTPKNYLWSYTTLRYSKLSMTKTDIFPILRAR